MSSDNSVLVVIELSDDKAILPVSLECLMTGRILADAFGGRLLALIIGNGISDAGKELSHYNLETVYVVDHPMLDVYRPEAYLSAFTQVHDTITPKAIVMGDTLTSIDLAPRIAFSLNTGLVTDCVGVECTSGEVWFIKPVYSGNIMAAYAFTTEPLMATMRSRVQEPAERRNEVCAEIIALDVNIDPSAITMESIKRILEKDEGPRLAHAEIIVSGGRGIGGAEGFRLLSELCTVLHAALGASRPPCDLGWVHPKAQVGQTGEKVGPSVYVAVGISGATQHIAGMSGSKTVVAINKDPQAAIFRAADYGVVGKYEEVVPAFKEALSHILKW